MLSVHKNMISGPPLIPRKPPADRKTEKKNCALSSFISTVEPIFNDISNSDNCCYNDRFANPRFFISLRPIIYFYNNECKKSLTSVITTTWSESLGVKRKETR